MSRVDFTPTTFSSSSLASQIYVKCPLTVTRTSDIYLQIKDDSSNAFTSVNFNIIANGSNRDIQLYCIYGGSWNLEAVIEDVSPDSILEVAFATDYPNTIKVKFRVDGGSDTTFTRTVKSLDESGVGTWFRFAYGEGWYDLDVSLRGILPSWPLPVFTINTVVGDPRSGGRVEIEGILLDTVLEYRLVPDSALETLLGLPDTWWIPLHTVLSQSDSEKIVSLAYPIEYFYSLFGTLHTISDWFTGVTFSGTEQLQLQYRNISGWNNSGKFLDLDIMLDTDTDEPIPPGDAPSDPDPETPDYESDSPDYRKGGVDDRIGGDTANDYDTLVSLPVDDTPGIQVPTTATINSATTDVAALINIGLILKEWFFYTMQHNRLSFIQIEQLLNEFNAFRIDSISLQNNIKGELNGIKVQIDEINIEDLSIEGMQDMVDNFKRAFLTLQNEPILTNNLIYELMHRGVSFTPEEIQNMMDNGSLFIVSLGGSV